VLALAFGVLVVFPVVARSLWIMADLNSVSSSASRSHRSV